MRRVMVGMLMVSALWTLTAAAQQPSPQTQELRTPDVHYVPTPQAVVDAMLRIANVTARDVVYDLGCGDGRIPVTAAQRFGAKGIGIDIDPARISDAIENEKLAGVTDKVTVLNQDLFTTDISEATVVTLYLLPSLNLKVLPKLNAELKPGTRIVSHAFDMGDWAPEERVSVGSSTVYLWRVPKG